MLNLYFKIVIPALNVKLFVGLKLTQLSLRINLLEIVGQIRYEYILIVLELDQKTHYSTNVLLGDLVRFENGSEFGTLDKPELALTDQQLLDFFARHTQLVF